MNKQTLKQQVLNHIQNMAAGKTSDQLILWLGDEVIETATGRSRGEGSISILEATQYKWGIMLNINDQARGYRGTAALDDYMTCLDEEFESGRNIRLEIGKARDRRAMWQMANDDTREGNYTNGY